MAKTCLCALGTAAAILLLAACGGTSTSKSGGSGAAANSSGNVGVSQAQCQTLGEVVTDLGLSEVAGFDYAKARTFFDNFDPPAKIRDDVGRVRDFVDKLASAEEDAGVKSGDQPVGDQISQIQGKLHISDDDRTKNGQAFVSLQAYNSNGCD
jgi:hypothetical protein